MLELRPSCEHCTRPLDPSEDDARICSFECTFCARCATTELLGVCPNCGGELVSRPRRPVDHLAKNPPRSLAVHRPVDLVTHHADVLNRLRSGDLPAQVWSVSFSSRRTSDADDGYGATAEHMDQLAAEQPGFLGVDSLQTDDGLGITVSRWSSIAAMVTWRRVAAHQEAQQNGRSRWYDWYRSDVARVDRTSEFGQR